MVISSDIYYQVLNAGKNKLRSMDEVKSLVSLRALILNGVQIIHFMSSVSDSDLWMFAVLMVCDVPLSPLFLTDNEIASISRLDHMKELNTLGMCLQLSVLISCINV